jgi:hypothetical protein
LKVREYSEEDAEQKRRLHLKTIREVNARDYSDKQIEA